MAQAIGPCASTRLQPQTVRRHRPAPRRHGQTLKVSAHPRRAWLRHHLEAEEGRAEALVAEPEKLQAVR